MCNRLNMADFGFDRTSSALVSAHMRRFCGAENFIRFSLTGQFVGVVIWGEN
jgi:hypothetical protein